MLSFFFILVILAAFLNLEEFRNLLRLLSNALLFLIAFVSILIGRPFILQYAKERSPKETWKTPEFFHASFVISWFWCVAFLFNLLFDIARTFLLEMPRLVGIAVPIFSIFAALKLTELYSKRLKSSRAPDPV